MNHGNREILGVVRKSLTAQQIEHSHIYWGRTVLPQGAQIKAGMQTFTMPFAGSIVFVDLAPGANWAHPCLFLFIEHGSLATVVENASFPPNMDRSPATFIPLLRYGKKPGHRRGSAADGP